MRRQIFLLFKNNRQIVSELIHFKIMSTIVSCNIILVLSFVITILVLVMFSTIWIPNIDSEHILPGILYSRENSSSF